MKSFIAKYMCHFLQNRGVFCKRACFCIYKLINYNKYSRLVSIVEREVILMKKFFSMLMCFALCAMLITPMSVSAAELDSVSNDVMLESATYTSNYFSGQTKKMNSLNGTESAASSISSGSINSEAKVTKVTLNVTVSSGSSGFYIIVEDPYGNYAEKYVSRSGEVTFDEFNGLYAKGTWKVSIQTVGMVSTATARMRVDYAY